MGQKRQSELQREVVPQSPSIFNWIKIICIIDMDPLLLLQENVLHAGVGHVEESSAA